MNSAIYHGWLRHRRFAPAVHQFSYPLFMVYLDLAELDTVFRKRWLWSTTRLALARFRRSDYLGDASVPLDQAVRDRVEQHTGRRPGGPIRLLTHLRYFGYSFNPVSFYYCFDAAGQAVETIVAEITNTPWRERHCYVLDRNGAPASNTPLTQQTDKIFHVSPFMPMGLRYLWSFSPPGETLNVFMALRDEQHHVVTAADMVRHPDNKVFDANLHLVRAPIDSRWLATALARFPLMSLQIVLAIHWQALRLWLKRVPVFTHPAK